MEFDLEAALQACARSELVSFDVFDTALLRQVARPSDIFRVMEPQVHAIVGREIPAFVPSRLAAEATAKSNSARSHRPLTLDRIYNQFRVATGLTVAQGEALARLEMMVEKKFTCAHPLILRLWRHAMDLKKNVIFLSDMYLPSSFIQQILEFHGYASPKVYVSAEWGGNKGSGKLYRIVQEHLKMPAHRCLHFGDNFYADVLRARWNGWRAIHTTGANRRPDTELVRPAAQTEAGALSKSITLGLTRKNATLRAYPNSGNADAFWDGFGYEIVGPIYFHYLHWLCRQAHRDNVHRLLLCARDGYPLLRGFEILRKAWGIPIEATYFFASRRLVNLAAIRELTPAALDFLLMPNPGLTLRDFVLRLNLDPAAQEPALRALGFKSLDQQVTHDYFGRFLQSANNARLRRWLDQIQEELLSRFAKERLVLEAYFHEVKVDDPGTAFVDVGWKATVAQAVQDLVRQRKPDFSLRGYFFGTFAGAEKLVRSGGQVESFFMHLGQPPIRQRLVSVNEGMIELLFAAPHGSIVGLKQSPQGIIPLHAKSEYTSEQWSDLKHMQAGANRFIEEAALLLPNYLACAPSAGQVERCLSQLLLQPTRDQAYHHGRMPYRVSFGESDSPRPFADPSNQTYGQAPWKRGYLAQVGRPQGWFLKIAFFLSGCYAALNSGTFWKSVKWALVRK
jgi:predicted HAD superfamily hydrolase